MESQLVEGRNLLFMSCCCVLFFSFSGVCLFIAFFSSVFVKEEGKKKEFQAYPLSANKRKAKKCKAKDDEGKMCSTLLPKCEDFGFSISKLRILVERVGKWETTSWNIQMIITLRHFFHRLRRLRAFVKDKVSRGSFSFSLKFPFFGSLKLKFLFHFSSPLENYIKTNEEHIKKEELTINWDIKTCSTLRFIISQMVSIKANLPLISLTNKQTKQKKKKNQKQYKSVVDAIFRGCSHN